MLIMEEFDWLNRMEKGKVLNEEGYATRNVNTAMQFGISTPLCSGMEIFRFDLESMEKRIDESNGSGFLQHGWV